VVWCGVVWCGVVWCGVVWCGVVRCGAVWCGVVWGRSRGSSCQMTSLWPVGSRLHKEWSISNGGAVYTIGDPKGTVQKCVVDDLMCSSWLQEWGAQMFSKSIISCLPSSSLISITVATNIMTCNISCHSYC